MTTEPVVIALDGAEYRCRDRVPPALLMELKVWSDRTARLGVTGAVPEFTDFTLRFVLGVLKPDDAERFRAILPSLSMEDVWACADALTDRIADKRTGDLR